ncbi:MAG: ORF6N domain-containing protein [Flavobacteriaceae bacterium]|nr:ORF6N domain-containing protein [Flavobacteriaceae bacterium]
MSRYLTLTDDKVINKIYTIREKKVMLDRDLAEMYGVETSQLKRQVKRNIDRFPEDFMFEMNKEELQNWRSQFGISNEDKMGLRYAPFCFTEQGIAMLSSVLSSKTAIEVNIKIIRIFTRIREILLTHKDVLLKMELLEKTMLKQNEITNKHEEEIQLIFNALKRLLDPPQEPREPIGYKTKNI